MSMIKLIEGIDVLCPDTDRVEALAAIVIRYHQGYFSKQAPEVAFSR
jgi:hypothetical protein